MSRWGECDYKQLENLKKQLETVRSKQREDYFREAAKELAARFLAKVIKRTPTVTGTLRRSWTIGEVRKRGTAYEVEIINPMEYASYVEYGHRQTPGRFVPAIGKTLKTDWVKGRFMLTISEQELTAEAPAVLEKKLIEVLQRCFDGK